MSVEGLSLFSGRSGHDWHLVRYFTLGQEGSLHVGLLVQDQAAFFDVLGCFLGWIRCGSWGQPYTAQTRSASSAVASRRSGSMTLRLPWSHLGSIGLSQGLLIGR